MKIKFWGVRGSIPSPGPETVKYGGNTICLEVRFKSPDRLIIIDAGSGIRRLGNYLMANDIPQGLSTIDIFLTHTHWDHIIGLTSFKPMFIPGMKIRIHGPATYESNSLAKVLSGQFMYRYFPVRLEELESNIEFIELVEDSFDMGGGVRLTTKYLNHPIRCMGYRFEHKDKSFATVFDSEPFANLFCTDPADPGYDAEVSREGEVAAAEQNQLIEQWLADADLIIHDAQYTRQEYKTAMQGWGHCSMEDAIDTALNNRVKKLALIHHDPDRTDKQIDLLAEQLCLGDENSDLNVFFAREEMEILI